MEAFVLFVFVAAAGAIFLLYRTVSRLQKSLNALEHFVVMLAVALSQQDGSPVTVQHAGETTLH